MLVDSSVVSTACIATIVVGTNVVEVVKCPCASVVTMVEATEVTMVDETVTLVATETAVYGRIVPEDAVSVFTTTMVLPDTTVVT